MKHGRVVAVLWALFAPAAAAAQQAPSAVSPVYEDGEPALAALVAEALAKNPDLRASEQAVIAARAVPAQAGALPDPMLSVSYTNDGWAPSLGEEDMTTLGFMWSQDLPWPGKRALRTQISERGTEQVEQQLARARLGVAAAVRRAYHALRQARMLRDLVRDQGEVWGQIEGVARARYSVGQGAQQDLLRTQIEVTRVGQMEAEQNAEEAVRVAELNRLLGRAAETPIETPTAPPVRPLQEPAETVLERLRAKSPELAAARVAVEQARLGVALARKDFKPDFTVQGGYMNRGGLDPMWQAGVGVTLPLARARRKGALAEAEARVIAAERRVEAVEAQLRFRTQERLARSAAIERMAELYEKGIVPQDRLSVESAIASYQAGRVPFVSVLESLGTLFLDRGTFVRLLAGHAQERATLEEASLEAVGGMPALGSNGMGGVPSMAAPAWEDGKAGAASRAMSGAGSMREQE